MPLDTDRVAALASLNEPLRRRLYEYVSARDEPVRRETAATDLGIARSVAAFHLDKLVDLGLLDVEFRRPPGRSGPGAGRPAKWYRPSSKEIALSVPERHYDLAAELLARAISDSAESDVAVVDSLENVALEEGRVIGSEVERTSDLPAIEQLCGLLAEHGYEPKVVDRTLILSNCPFHALAEEHRGLVCGMNLSLMKGIVEGAGVPGVEARLDPAPGRCCVTLAS
jgi:predicted ArsR family transcriptional regulator